MPRQRRGSAAPARSAPTRPTTAPARPNVTPPQPPSRGAATAAAPTAQKPQVPVQQGSAGSGLFGQMASTAAGVAVGSSIGHAIGGFFGGGSGAAAETQPADSAVASQAPDGTYRSGSWNCEQDAKSFTQCLDQNQGNMQICGWYLDQLKACQSASSQY
ncbi:MAG: hypothetical protein FRX48_07897 [Lasallia pustulata]|uniref:Cysteine alpha-hairpin motif superfamily n=1 Tax=Lasallia pustulata TaxID=136370 RepID=A0A1W5D5R1_9LECA|nr:MAG: hypothetical protein FRX48_07897 [Lasallia pustulata]SLM38467.1 Cysteine alpha-hairpin motif superfamily [Lasallia pustulata]